MSFEYRRSLAFRNLPGLSLFADGLRFCRLAAIALMCGGSLQAQVPESIALVKMGVHQQISATSLVPEGAEIVVDVFLPSSAPSSATVSLQKPSGETILLAKNANGLYAFDEFFSDEAHLSAAYPDGSYKVLVAGGSVDTTTSFPVAVSVATPVRITNYDALHTAGEAAQVTWQDITTHGTSHSLYLDLLSSGGVLLSNEALSSPAVTTGAFLNLLAGESYTGFLLYFGFDITVVNGGQTAIGIGSAFAVEFPIVRGAAVLSAPATPATAGAYASGPREVTVSWQPPVGSNPAIGYKLERATDATFTSALVTLPVYGAATSYIDTGVAANTTYYYRLSAGNESGTSAPTPAMKVLTPAAVGFGSTRFVNIATRAYCSTGNNVTIGGFVISGTLPKRVLVRAVGPSLTGQGLGASEVLLDPTMEVHQGTRVVASNDNWGDNTNATEISAVGAQIGATPLLGTDTKSAALLLTLSPGVYSFVVNSKSGTAGIVLLEVYDADTTGVTSTFVNIATRAYSTSANGVTIGGFVVSGGASKQILIRAVGPTLVTQGISSSEALANPVIELHQGVPVIATNDNWIANTNANGIRAAAARIGATPFASTDTASSALLLKLPPGVYSFIARGKSDTSGIVLVEVYDAD